MNFDEQELFKGKSFSSLLKDIYTTTKNKEKQINVLISELKPLVKNIGDATIIVPLIKDYLEIGVKNDEHLVKMAAVVQRAMTRQETGGGEFQLTDALNTQANHKEIGFTELRGKHFDCGSINGYLLAIKHAAENYYR